MDKKDEIIIQQLELIRTMTENSLGRISSDLWGASPPPQPKKPDAPPVPQPEKDAPKQAVEGGPEEAAPAPVPEEPVPTIEELKAELDTYIGLDNIKKEVNNLINMVTVYNMRKEHKLPTTSMSLHMVFSGNPGTGKTMIARLMSKIYRSLGILSKGHLVEVDRSGLVAGYVGQTAIKTSKVIGEAMGGLLFIDEAYGLSNKGDNDFGHEAIDTLLKAMEDKREDLVVVVAGYDGLMDDFIHSNPGLESRFNRYLHFDDYTLNEMVDIFKLQCKKGFYTLGEEAEKEVRYSIELGNKNSISFGNARGVRNIFEHILTQQANRLASETDITPERLMEILPCDVIAARGPDPKDALIMPMPPSSPQKKKKKLPFTEDSINIIN